MSTIAFEVKNYYGYTNNDFLPLLDESVLFCGENFRHLSIKSQSWVRWGKYAVNLEALSLYLKIDHKHWGNKPLVECVQPIIDRVGNKDFEKVILRANSMFERFEYRYKLYCIFTLNKDIWCKVANDFGITIKPKGYGFLLQFEGYTYKLTKGFMKKNAHLRSFDNDMIRVIINGFGRKEMSKYKQDLSQSYFDKFMNKCDWYYTDISRSSFLNYISNIKKEGLKAVDSYKVNSNIGNHLQDMSIYAAFESAASELGLFAHIHYYKEYTKSNSYIRQVRICDFEEAFNNSGSFICIHYDLMKELYENGKIKEFLNDEFDLHNE